MAKRRRGRKKRANDYFPQAIVLSVILLWYWLYTVTQSRILPPLLLMLPIVGYYAVKYYIQDRRRDRLLRSGIAEIDKMDGRQFELYLSHLFGLMGYKTKVTQYAGDFGADLILKKDNRTIVVQAKRYSNNVGLKAVQEANTAINHYKANEAWVVSNSEFTEQAKTLAASNHVRLIGREELIQMILSSQQILQKKVASANPEPVKQQPDEVSSDESTRENETMVADEETLAHEPLIVEHEASKTTDELLCEKCGGRLVKKKGRYGDFLGCNNFPICKHTKSLL